MQATKKMKNVAGALIAAVLLSVTLFADTGAASRYDNQVQTAVTHKLDAKKQFRDVKASVEDGIVTLTGSVDLYQRKLDAAKLARKAATCAGRPQPDHRGRTRCPRCTTGAETGDQAALCESRI